MEVVREFRSQSDPGARKNLTYYYYDLLSQSVSYSVAGGALPSFQILNYSTGPGAPGQSDTIVSTSIVLTQSPQTIWALRGTSASIPPIVQGAEGERWAGPTGYWFVESVDSIPSPISYYQQFSQTISYETNGTTEAPLLWSSYLGSPQTGSVESKATVFWVDQGTTVSLTNPLTGSNSEERWITTISSWAISRSNSVPSVITYYDQYNLSLSFAENGGGSWIAPTLSLFLIRKPREPDARNYIRNVLG